MCWVAQGSATGATLPYEGENYTPAMADLGGVQSDICDAKIRSTAQIQALVSLGCMEDDLIALALLLFKQMSNSGSNNFQINE